MTKGNESKAASEDFIPEIADDPVEGAEVSDRRELADRDTQQGDAEAADTRDAGPTDHKSDAREEALRRYREMRDLAETETREKRGLPPLKAEGAELDADATDPSGDTSEPVARTTDAAPASLADDAEIELKVYGQSIKRKLGDIKADAQRLIASEQLFDEAKRLKDEVKALKDAQSQRARDPDPEHQPVDDAGNRGRKTRKSDADDGQEHQPDDLDTDSLDSIVERIQIGDKDEGRAAISDLVKLVMKGNTSRIDESKVREIVRQDIVQTDTKKEINAALETFTKKFPSIASDDDLTDVALRRVQVELRADLKASGMSDDDISKIKESRDLASLHGEVRRKGAKVRTYDALLTDVGTYLSKKFGTSQTPETLPAKTTLQQPPATSKTQQRVDAKRAAIQQPKAAGAKTPTQQAPRPKTHSEIISEMRKARGFGSYR